MTRQLLFIFLLFWQCILFAQNEANIWYFGKEAGLDFSNDTVSVLTDGALITSEGCATISDASGKLLFYTDGINIYNKSHKVMPNGSGLLGHGSSTQSAVIVKKPGNTTLYYVFTVDQAHGKDGLRYSVVDITLRGGLGDVTSVKNVLVVAPTCEKISAIRHRNNRDFWIVTHLFGSNIFHSYLLNPNGLLTTPTISRSGTPIQNSTLNKIGYLKASTQGNLIAIANWHMDNVELFDFNNFDGKISNPTTFRNFSGSGAYGLEFSPNGKLLYVSEATSTGSRLYQYNLKAGDKNDVINSRITLYNAPGYSGALQLAPNGKIYQARVSADYLGVINNPDQLGSACNYSPKGIFLNSRMSYYGLPTFINRIIDTFSVTNMCYGDSTMFATTATNVDSVSWDFGDTSSGVYNYSVKTTTKHVYSDTGAFKATLYLFIGQRIDTLVKTINIYSPFTMTLGPDTSLCIGDSLKLDVTISNGYYRWSDTTSQPSYVIYEPGIYWVSVTQENKCTVADTIDVKYHNPPLVDLGRDTTLCEWDSLILDATESNSYYYWNNGSRDSSLTVFQKGIYWVQVTQNNCSTIDSIAITTAPLPEVDLGQDTTLCDSDTMTLEVAKSTYSRMYLWHDKSRDSVCKVTEPGIYWVNVTENNCTSTDSIRVEFDYSPKVFLGNDTTLCMNQEVLLEATTEHGSYLWNDSSTVSHRSVNHSGVYWVRVENVCGKTSDTIVVEFNNCDCLLFVPNAFSPNFDGLNDHFSPSLDCSLSKYNLAIFNRWGEKLYETNNHFSPWDGTYKGEMVESDVYLYILTFQSKNGDRVSDSGLVHLLR